MSSKEEVAAFIKNRRLELGLTLEELAILIYDNPAKKAQIGAYENGKRSLSLDTLDLFLEALQIDLKLTKKGI